MKTITLMILVAMALCCCSACDESAAKDAKAEPFGISIQSVELFENGGNGYYRLVVRIRGASAAQELSAHGFDGAHQTLVEYFEVADGGWHDDVHTDGVGTTREMTIYPATVEGCEVRDGYAKLAENIDGSFITNALGNTLYPGGVGFGRVASAKMDRAIHYRHECRADGLLVEFDGESHWFPMP